MQKIGITDQNIQNFTKVPGLYLRKYGMYLQLLLFVFRTIVEHLIMLLERKEFTSNSMNTGWYVFSRILNFLFVIVFCSVGPKAEVLRP